MPPILKPPRHTIQTTSPSKSIANIEVNGSYVLMKNVETDPEYGRLLDELLDEIQILSEPLDPGVTDRVAFLMISSPHAITPYHMDREMNFLLQVQGNKEVHLWDPADRQVVSEDELETYFAWHSLAKTKYRDEIQSKAHVFKLTPGDGVHHPSTAPHWVKNGNEVSISFSTTFWSRASKRRDLVYRSNFALRRLGLKPRPFGESPLIDSVKHRGFRAYSAAKRLLGR
ncbi:MAG: cupin-like domain-containing protein [Myxococcota bacterium]